jgi:hypothetical protein
MNSVFLKRLDDKSVASDYLFVIEELERQRDILITQRRQQNEALQANNRVMSAILKSQGGSITITDDALVSLQGNLEIITKRDPDTNSLQIVLIEHDQS